MTRASADSGLWSARRLQPYAGSVKSANHVLDAPDVCIVLPPLRTRTENTTPLLPHRKANLGGT